MVTARKNGLERRDEILDAALSCFARLGILETGIEDVRRAAGASPSSVYHLFGGMPGIVVALLGRTFERYYGQVFAQIAPHEDARALVQALIEAHFDFLLAHKQEARFMYQALALELAGAEKKEVDRLKTARRKPIVRRLQNLVRAGALPDWPPLVLEIVILGPCHDASRKLLAGHALDVGWLRQELPKVAWRAVGKK